MCPACSLPRVACRVLQKPLEAPKTRTVIIMDLLYLHSNPHAGRYGCLSNLELPGVLHSPRPPLQRSRTCAHCSNCAQHHAKALSVLAESWPARLLSWVRSALLTPQSLSHAKPSLNSLPYSSLTKMNPITHSKNGMHNCPCIPKNNSTYTHEHTHTHQNKQALPSSARACGCCWCCFAGIQLHRLCV